MYIIKPSWLRHSGKSADAQLGTGFAAFCLFFFCLFVLLFWEQLLTVPVHAGEQKDFEVYSCHISPDGSRLATAGGGTSMRLNNPSTSSRRLC